MLVILQCNTQNFFVTYKYSLSQGWKVHNEFDFLVTVFLTEANLVSLVQFEFDVLRKLGTIHPSAFDATMI